jgi:hypothetical protein
MYGSITYVDDEIYNYLAENIKNGIYNNNKKKYKKGGFEDDLDIIPEDKRTNPNVPIKGLDDNNSNDNDLKLKAKKGLLLLLNKMSTNAFCPDIRKYYKKLHEDHEQNLRTSRKDTKKVTDVGGVNNKTIRRQNYIDKLESVKDLKNNESIKDEDIIKLNLRNNEKKNMISGNKSSYFSTTFKRKKTKDRKPTMNNNPAVSTNKNYKNDIHDIDLKLFYSESEIENSKKQLNEKKLRPGLNKDKKRLQSLRRGESKRNKKKKQSVFNKNPTQFLQNQMAKTSVFKKPLQLEKNIESQSGE